MLGHGCIGEFSIGEFDIPSSGVAGWTGKVTRISREQADKDFKKVDWYDRFLAAKTAVEQRADKSKPAQKKALQKAVEAATEVEKPELIEPVTMALEAAAAASRATASINHANRVLEIIRQLEMARDEEEAEVLLLN